MIRIFILSLTIFTYSHSIAQNPDWGTLLALDKAQYIVVAKMHVENLQEGLGKLEIIRIIKGDPKTNELSVQFSDRHQKEGFHKHEETPKYWYSEGTEGIWILYHENTNNRFDLRQHNLFYLSKWEDRIKGSLTLLEKRKWTLNENGLSGSVIIDNLGGNKLYRFFYLCLRNDSNIEFYINTHYRIQNNAQQRINATISTPDNETIDMMNGGHNGCRISGEPGWPEPIAGDFILLKPGQKIYLLSSGNLRCFFKEPPPGDFTFKSSYNNQDYKPKADNITWKGELVFPELEFNYGNW